MSAEVVALSQAAALPVLLQPVSAAATANATTPFIDLSGFEGVCCIEVSVGAVTGSITTSVDESIDGSTAAVTGSTNVSGVGAILTGANQLIKFDTRSVKRYVRVVGSIVTGPVLIGVTGVGMKKFRP